MICKQIFLLPALLSLTAAIATPNYRKYHEVNANLEDHRHPTEDYEFGLDKDIVYETVTDKDCGIITIFVTEYAPISTSSLDSGSDANVWYQTEIKPSVTGSGAKTAAFTTYIHHGSPPVSTRVSSIRPKPTVDCQNGPRERACWKSNYTIDTDCKKEWPHTGAVVEYWLTVENGTLAPDGFERQVITFNGTIPGPLITANWGDTIRVHVKNNLLNNGTSVHWHGFRQLNTNDQDGTNGITECPLAPGQSKTYEFVATTYGTSWYHSHFSSQYGDGTVGPIVIHGPASADYDEDLGPILVQDWYHKTVFETEHYAQHVGPPKANNYLLNGINTAVDSKNGSSTGSRLTLKFQKGKKYLLRLINGSTDNHFKIGLDGHNFTVIAADFSPLEPFETDVIPIGVGQRYDVIVKANADVNNYWFRAVNSQQCGVNDNTGFKNANGIISYEGAPAGLPVSSPRTYAAECHDIPATDLVPIVSYPVDQPGFSVAAENTLAVGRPSKAIASYNAEPVFVWSLDGVAIDISWEDPTLLKLQNGISDFTPAENVIKLNSVNAWTYWIVQNQFQIAHPMHLHGHDFSLLGQGPGIFSAENNTVELNFNNPTRRDTAMLIENGWTAIAFKTDNPGAWLFHCHIGWHVGGGLSLQFLERESEILSTLRIGSDFKNTCDSWQSYIDAGPFYQKHDSGL
ncbi:Cupredoxin [Bisporella sp. PMI_857]|nr:Cupredoxin [Bisporella sp. PMI_857]